MEQSVNTDKKAFLITEDYSIKAAMKHMNSIGKKALFIVDEKSRLIGSLSDGDIRRWILANGSLEKNVKEAFNKKPIYMLDGFRLEDAKKLMINETIEYVPVLNEKNQVIEIILWDEVFSGKAVKTNKNLNIRVVIMAGGKGTRLDPFTRILPKALIPINNKPIIEIIMDKFSEYGIKEFFISINHKAKMIKSYFEDSNGKYRLHYLEEDKPLGTAGSLKLLSKEVCGNILVVNCDTIIESDYCELIDFHSKNGNDITLVASLRHYVIPFGVCEIENDGGLKAINEKPEHDLLVNTGMYVLKSEILDLIPGDNFYNITDLMIKAKEKGRKIGVFPINEKSWIDVGQWEEYRKAQERLSQGKVLQ